MLSALIVSAVYLGGAGVDDCDDITFDRKGFAYLACHSSSQGFIGADKKDVDAYVVKFDPRASKIVYATRLGGGSWDAAFRVVVDAQGRVWVSGTTQSPGFPFNYRQHTPPGRSSINAFVARLDDEGSIAAVAKIEDATGEGLVVTPDGIAYLTGTKAPNEENHYATSLRFSRQAIRGCSFSGRAQLRVSPLTSAALCSWPGSAVTERF